MTREDQIDWLCRLRAELNNGIIFTPWNKEFTEALTGILEQEPETVTEFADRCRECGARYGKLLKQQSCNSEDAMAKGYAKAFHFGMALGFAAKYDERDKIIEEVKKAVKESEEKTE